MAQTNAPGTAKIPTEKASWNISGFVYYAAPLINAAIVAACIKWGSAWLVAIFSTISKLGSFVWGSPDPANFTGQVMFMFALVCVAVSAARVNSALRIPLGATVGQTADRAFTFLPMVIVLGVGIWGLASGWSFDYLTKRFIMLYFVHALTFDAWLASLAQNIIKDARNTVGMR